jgi:glucarate dehydratase
MATTIAAIRATPVTVPLEAPLLHSNGAHWGRFVRTIVEVETADGYVGLGEMGGGGEDATRAFAGLMSYLDGHDVFALEALKLKICNPTASLYNNRTQLHAAIEFACLDIMGQKLGVPVHALLGGKLRDTVEFASYLFFRYANPDTGRGEVRTPEQLVAQAAELKKSHGFTSHKLKGGVYPPMHELACYRALAKSLPGERFRYDPNSALSLADAIAFGSAILDIRNDYFEDPVWGMPQLKRLKDFVPLADRDEHGGRQLRAARDQHPERRRRRHLARHDVLGRHPPVHQGGGRVRDDGPGVSRFTAPASSVFNLRRCCTWVRWCPISATRPTRITIIWSTT